MKKCFACRKVPVIKNFKYCKECRGFLRAVQGRDSTREVVRLRDSHKCRDCKKEWIVGERRFDIHHINGLCGKRSRAYDKINDIDGLITLCHQCHYNRPEHRCQSEDFRKVLRNRKSWKVDNSLTRLAI